MGKILNPFGIKVTNTGKLYVWLGFLSTIFLRGSFYFTLYHFISKFW